MSFENLISDLDALQELRKSASEPDEAPEDDAGEAALTKSLRTDDGEDLEYIDGTELVKSLKLDMDKQAADLLRVLSATTDLLKSQSAEIAELKDAVRQVADSGRGRRSVASVDAAPAAPAGVSADAFMTKAMAAQKAGRLTSVDVAIAEGSLSRGIDVPDHIKTIVFGE